MSTTEDEDTEREFAARSPAANQERRLLGLPACGGVAIGSVFRAIEPPAQITRSKIHAADIQAETARFEAALMQSRRQLLKLRSRLSMLPEESQGEIAPLLDAYLQMLGPSRLVRGTLLRIQERLLSAETAVMEEANAIAEALLARTSESCLPPQRPADEVREIGRRLVRNLTRAPFRSYSGAPPGSVLIAEALRPSDAALVDPARIAGVATEEGGTDGHTAIILRALGIPAVLGAPGLLQDIAPHEIAIVDGAAGVVTLHPSPASLNAARRAVAAFARERHQLGRLRRLSPVTLDGETIDLQANLELPIELPLVAQSGANGIGLLRTEFLFMNRATVPSENEQATAYGNVVETMAGDPVTIRVLDWGGEKEIEALVAAGLVPEIPDANPALGLRGVRLLLRRNALFETQLAAILCAARLGPVRVLLPMVTTVAEVRAARETYTRVAAAMQEQGIALPRKLPPLGIMIETPGAALSADALAAEADFFAIGTNDLCMYTLAVDRSELDVAHLYDPLHPAVLRLIQLTAEAAQRHKLPVSVCGEMAANPSFTPLLLGLGIRSFSTNASAVPRVKQAVRSTTMDDCQRLTWQVMKQSDPARTRELLDQFGR
jgi:phosphotransferase system enzyme I (PtsI)